MPPTKVGDAWRRAALRGLGAASLALCVASCDRTETTAPPGSTPAASFQTTVSQATALLAAGNIARCGTDRDDLTAQIIDTIAGTVLTLGDHAYPDGSTADYTNCYEPSWGRHRTRTFAALGDRDYKLGNADPTFDYFGAAAGPRGLGYYGVDLGSWRLIVLNDQLPFDAGSPQDQWLQNELAANGGKCIIAAWHKPRFFSSNTSGWNASGPRRILWERLYAAGADVVLNGHPSFYERHAPMTPDGVVDTARGIRQFIVGTGGQTSVQEPTVIAPNSEALAAAYGVLKLTLYSDRYEWQFMPMQGYTFTDAGAAKCHNAPEEVNQLPVANPGGPYAGAPGDTIRFDGSQSSDPDGHLPLSYAWDFGDGTTGTGPTPTHVYHTARNYTVTLTVADAQGGTSSPATTTVAIRAPYDPASPITLVGAGDVHAICGDATMEATAKLLDAIPGTVFTVGDNAEPDAKLADYQNCYGPTWGRHQTRTYATLGNHDYDLGNAEGSFDYWGARVGPPGKGYYSYDLGNWHIVVLNSNGEFVPFAAGSAQDEWLKADLAATGDKCIMAMWHHPRFFSNTEGATEAVGYKILWDRLYAAGADVIVNAHQHHYERFAPQDPSGNRDIQNGIRAFIAGTAGAPTRTPNTIAVNSDLHSTTHGVLKFTLRPDGYDWEFVPVAGSTFTDSGSANCHNVLTLTNDPPVANPGGPYADTTGGAITFDGTGSGDPDGDLLVSYNWDFGDGTTGSGPTPLHTYPAPGIYTVALTVTDARGATSAVSTTLATISSPPPPPTSGTSAVLVAVGNIANCSNNRDEMTAQIVDTIPATVVALGDNAFPDGTLADYTNCYEPTWGRHKARTYAALGNHDYDVGNADGTFDYFGDRAGPRGLGYYSFDLGDWHIIVINSNSKFVPYSAGSAQDQWLQNDLAANTKKCTLAIWHHPRFFSSNSSGWNSSSGPKILWERLYAANADLVVNANPYFYERFAPQTPAGAVDTTRGIREFIVGTGGQVSVQAPTAIAPNSEAVAAAYGVLKLTLYADRYTWQFFPMQGHTFTDSGVGSCH